jgi:autotransporter-associated beta strand protein
MKIQNLLIIPLLATSYQAQAVTETWDGGDASNNAWGATLNWADNTITFGNDLDIVYDGGTDTESNFLGANRIIRSLTYTSFPSAGHTMNMASGGGISRDLTFEADSGNSTVTIDENKLITWAEGTTFDAGGNGDVILNNDLDIVHNGSGVFRINSEIKDGTGSNKITLSGGGIVELRPANATTDTDPTTGNTFGGGLEIQNGSVRVFMSDTKGANSALSTGAITLSGATTADSTLIIGTTGTVLTETITNNFTLNNGGGTISVGNASANATFSGVISGTGDLRKTGNGDITLSGANTFTGDLENQNNGTIFLASTGELTFEIGASGVNNGIVGAATGSLDLDGIFNFDLTAAGSGLTDEWTIIQAVLLANTTFGSNFSVAGFTGDSGVWTSGIYEFSQSTGLLTVVPEPSSYALLGGLLALSWVMVRRRS